jgi:hypothetical protein
MDDKKFIDTVNNCKTMSYASKITGMSYGSFKKKAISLNCFNPNPSGRGTKKTKSFGFIPLEEILSGQHPEYQTFKLKRRLIREGILEDKCCRCGWSEKMPDAEFSSCELEHIDGNPTNHKRENLEILCPNCHSLTESYRFRRGKTNGIN